MIEHLNIFSLFVLLYISPSSYILAQTKTGQLNTATDQNTVEYVTGLFRHGEHTVDAGSVYPNDPYINETYYPYGVGQLTARGKEREFALGQLLRKRYNNLLGSVYTPDLIDPISTDMNRTKASLQLVLAGLYQPKGNIMEWNSNLNWQPIPYNYLNYENDMWLTISIYFCANYAKEYSSYLSKGEGKQIQDKYEKLYQYLRDATGLNIRRTMEIFFVYSCLQSQTDWGLNLPEWTERVWPEIMTQATIDGLTSSVATTKLKQLSGGPILKKIIDNMKAKANGTLEPDNRKVALYSGHDLNIVYLLGAMNVFTPHIVPYGACVLVELHKIGSNHFVKVLYEDYVADQPRILTIPGCEQLCPLNKFESLLKVNLPEKDNDCGDDVKVFEENKQQRDYYTGKIQYKSLIRRYVEWVFSTTGLIVKTVFGVGVGILEKTKDTVQTANTHIIEKGKGIFGRITKPLGL